MNEMMNTTEVAQAFNVTATTIYYWWKAGKLRSFKHGSRRLFRKEDVDDLLAKQNQLNLETAKRDRTPEELKFFEQLKTKLTEEESMELMISPLAEGPYHEFILKMAKKYKVPIPEWFKRECRIWNVST